MAREVRLVSDLSGDLIETGRGAVVTIKYADGRKPPVVLDVTDPEADDLATKGRKVARRGRKPKAAEPTT